MKIACQYDNEKRNECASYHVGFDTRADELLPAWAGREIPIAARRVKKFDCII
jgi:hypothetical protein